MAKDCLLPQEPPWPFAVVSECWEMAQILLCRTGKETVSGAAISGFSWYIQPSAKQVLPFTGKRKIQSAPGRVVDMWVMGRESSMLLDIGTCRETLQGSGVCSRGGCRSAFLSVSSVLQGWLGDKDWAGTCGSETGVAAGGATGGASSDTLANSLKKNKKKTKMRLTALIHKKKCCMIL